MKKKERMNYGIYRVQVHGRGGQSARAAHRRRQQQRQHQQPSLTHAKTTGCPLPRKMRDKLLDDKDDDDDDEQFYCISSYVDRNAHGRIKSTTKTEHVLLIHCSSIHSCIHGKQIIIMMMLTIMISIEELGLISRGNSAPSS